MITSTTLYRRRGMHRQREFDHLYLTASFALVAFALSVALSPSNVDQFAFSVYVPVLSIWAAWNDTRQAIAGRVWFWQESNWWGRNIPGAICLVPVGQLTLAYAALPSFTASAIAAGWIDTALWTSAFLALFSTAVYTILGLALALTSKRAVAYGLVFVLFVELIVAPYLDLVAWFSPGEWVRAAALTIPGDTLYTSPVPIAAGFALLAIFSLLALMWGSSGLIIAHRDKYTAVTALFREEDPS